MINLRILFKLPMGGDRLRARAPTIVHFLLLICLCGASSFECRADLDLSLSTYARSYPLSGVLTSDVGYGLLLWGAPANPWYGYLRPRVEVSSSGSYNSVDAGMEFYPLSFLGVRAGGEGVQNDANYRAYDCQVDACQGRYYRTYLNGELTLGAGPLFLQLRFRRERWTQADRSETRSFVEPTGGFAINPSGDSETVMRAMLGMRLATPWSLIGGVSYAQLDQSRGISRLPYALVRYSRDSLTMAVGAGVFHSPLKTEEGTALAYLEWTLLPSLALH